MVNKPTVITDNRPPAILQKGRGRSRKLRSGQSLVEFAFSVTILVLIFSGAVDLGRAFFTRIAMDSAISEALHWAAAYPGCLPYGVAQNVQATSNVPAQCVGNNSIMGRMLAEGNQLDTAYITKTSIAYTPQDASSCSGTGNNRCTSFLADLTPGDTVDLSMSYKLTLITPLMRGLFGDTLTLTADAKEVVRGNGLPPTNGVAFPQPSNLNPADPVTAGNYGESAGTGLGNLQCNGGLPLLRWYAKSATAYKIYATSNQNDPVTLADIDTSVTIPDSLEPSGATSSTEGSLQTNDLPASVATNGTTTFYYPDGTQQGKRSFKIVTVVGSAESSLDDSYLITALCPAVQVQTLSLDCNSTNTGATLTYAMDTSGGPLDAAVSGHTLYRNAVGNLPSVATLPADFSGGSITTSYSFTAATDYASANYFLQPKSASLAAFGNPNTTGAPLNCSYGTAGNTVPITVTVNDTLSSYSSGDPVTYTITVTNNGTDPNYHYARGLTVKGFSGTPNAMLTGQTWQCDLSSGTTVNGQTADCGNNSASTSGALDAIINLPPGTSINLKVTGTFPSELSSVTSYQGKATVGTPTLCSTNCVISGTLTATDTNTRIIQPDSDLYLSDPASQTTGTYVTNTPFTYTINFGNNTITGGNTATNATALISLPISNLPATSTATYQCVNVGTGVCNGNTTATAFTSTSATVTATLPMGQYVQIKIVVTPKTTESFTITGNVSGQGGTQDTNSANNSVQRAYTNTPGTADLGVAVSTSATSQSGATTLTFTINAYNGGPDAITGAYMGIGISPDSATASALYSTSPKITCSVVVSGATCGSIGGTAVNSTAQNIGANTTITGALYPTGTTSGSPAVKYFVTIAVPANFLYDITVSASVSIASPSGMTDGSTNANSGSATTTTNAGTTVVVNLGTTSGGVSFYPGNSIDLYFTVDNTSSSALSAATIALSDSSGALTGTYTWSCTNNCTMTSGTGTTSPSFSMPKNKTATIKVTVTTKTTTTSAFTVTGTLSVGVGFSNTGTKTQNITTGSVSGSGVANITVSIDDNGVTTYGVSQTINYDVTITNNSTTYGFYGGTLTIALNAGTNNIDTSAMPTAQCTTNCIDSTVYSPTVSSSSITISGLKVDLGKSGSGTNVQKIRLTMKTNSNANNLKGTTTGNATVYYLSGVTDSSSGTSKAASPAATASSQYEVDLGVTYSGTAPTSYTPGNTVTLTFQIKNNSTAAVTGVKLSDLLTIGNVVGASGSSYQCGTTAGGAVCTNGSTANMPTTATTFGPYTAGATNVTPIGSGKTIDLPGSATLIITVKVATSSTQGNTLAYTFNVAAPSSYTDSTTNNNSLTVTASALPAPITGGTQVGGSCSSSGSGANKVNAVSFSWPTQYYPNTGSGSYPTNAAVKYQITINGLSAIVTNGGGSASLATGKGTTVTITVTASTTTLAFTALPASYSGQQVTVKMYDPNNSATLLSTSSTIGTFTSC